MKIPEIYNPQVHDLLEIETDSLSRGICPPVCGLSVGAFAAAVIAGVLCMKDAIELVRLRAEGMMRLHPSSYGLSAIIGLTESQVSKIVQAETSDEPWYSLEASTRHARL